MKSDEAGIQFDNNKESVVKENNMERSLLNNEKLLLKDNHEDCEQSLPLPYNIEESKEFVEDEFRKNFMDVKGFTNINTKNEETVMNNNMMDFHNKSNIESININASKINKKNEVKIKSEERIFPIDPKESN